MTPTDPLYASQWHLGLLGNIERIWDEYNGTGVHVGVYDSGVDYLHEDLAANYNSALHVLDDLGNPVDPFPDAESGPHGTSCAGIVGAGVNNGVGGTGVAWGTQLTGVNIFSSAVYGFVNSGDINPFLHVVSQAVNFDISTNSWGSTPLYFPDQGLTGGGFTQLLDAEYSLLSANGRGGLGTIITQAAGNDTLDANGSGINSSRHTITVSATDEFGYNQDYSNFGACILVAAPAAAVTTDITGADGYDPGNYTTTFGGTSAATPVVAGVISLMLDANPNLGWRDIQNILANSASHTGTAIGGGVSGFEHGSWYVNAADNWNGGGMHAQTDYGYGMVNAYNAVRMAEIWTQMGAAQTSANEQIASSPVNNLGGVAIPPADPAGISFDLTVGTSLQIEHVQLVLNLSHTYVQDLRITMTSAEGTEVVVAQEVFSPGTAFNGEWVYGIDTLRGELSAGTWTVNIVDTYEFFDEGFLNSASLNVYGSAPTVNDVWHFTDEFLAMAALDPARSVINDSDGGVDWLNFAAVAGNLSVSLGAGASFGAGGVAWGTVFAETIENVIGGDGLDTINGNSLANRISGMRGNDTLFGHGADDIVYGGGGTDRIYGGAGNEVWLAGDAGADTITGGDGNDRIDGGADNDVWLAGEAGADTVTGGLGNDRVDGGTDNDVWLAGDAGADTVTGGGGNDRLDGGADNDAWLGGDAGIDTVTGGIGNDRIDGGADNDAWLAGDSGIDTVTGGVGNDRIDGGADNDAWLAGDSGIDTVTGGVGNDRIDGGADNDAWLAGDSGIDTITGGLGNDRIDGGTENDILYGQDGGDTITGGAGNDHIEGGAGNDLLYGNAGLDTFDFNPGSGLDTIYDFVNDQDTLRIDPGYGFANAAAVVAAITASGTSALVNLGGGNVVTLSGYLAANTITSLTDDITIA